MKILMASASFFAKICTSLRSVLKFFNAHHSRFTYVLHMAPLKCRMQKSKRRHANKIKSKKKYIRKRLVIRWLNKKTAIEIIPNRLSAFAVPGVLQHGGSTFNHIGTPLVHKYLLWGRNRLLDYYNRINVLHKGNMLHSESIFVPEFEPDLFD